MRRGGQGRARRTCAALASRSRFATAALAAFSFFATSAAKKRCRANASLFDLANADA